MVEVGAGLGSLTLALLEAGAEVTAIEVDKHLAPVLRSVVEPGGATVVEADAMPLDWAALLGPEDPARPWALVANLPYNIAAPLVLDLLETAPAIERMVVLVQLEVGERLAAGPRHEDLRHPVGEAGVVGRRRRRRPGWRPACSSRSPGWSPRSWTSAGTPGGHRGRAGGGVRPRRDRLQPAPQDAPALPGRQGRPRACSTAAGIRPEARAEELTLADWQRLAGALA